MVEKKLIVLSLILVFVSLNIYGKIGIIVNKDLYPSIQIALTTYITDLNRIEGKDVWLDKDNFDDGSTPQELKNTLKEHYQNDNLEGAILIGDFEIARYNLQNDVFACDLYYMDMDGNWSGSGNIFSDHSGNKEAEIWISRITASVIQKYFGDEEIIVNKYFERVHIRMHGKDPQPRSYVIAGLYESWSMLEGENQGDLGYSPDSILTIRGSECGDEWKNALIAGKEYGFVYSHSSPTSHSIGFSLSDIADNSLNCRFFNCFATSNGDFEQANMVGAYALSNQGLVAVGSSKTGSMMPGSFEYYNEPLGNGKTFGEAFKDWFNAKGIKDVYWHYGMNLQGVGTLHLQPYPADTSIMIICPNGNEILHVGDYYNIRWASSGPIGDVKIEYSTNNGENWSILVNNTDDDGLYSWTVPNELSTTCLIRLSDASDSDPIDTSDAVFTISAPVIELSSPNGGEVLYEGGEHTITWENKGLVGNVDIEYSIDNGQNWLAIANNVANSGSHSWTVPGNPSSACLIRVSETADGDPVDISDNVFTLSPPVIELSSPNGGEAWYIGKSYNINWSTMGFVGGVKIEYSTDNGSSWSEIVNSTANDGSHSWTIPDKSSDLCKIRISEASDGVPFDESNGTFIIEIEPSVSLSFPVGGEVLYIDTTYTIRWSTIGRVGDVKLLYCPTNGTVWRVITDQTENDGLYDWKVPDITEGTYKVRISEASDGIPFEVSDEIYIEYAPSITVSYPNGGEMFYIGMVYKIKWVNKGTVGDIKIEYSSDNGVSWNIVVSRITNNGSYNWKIPDDESENCRLRISEASNDDIVDISDNVFSIAPPYIRVSVPNGGEVFYTGYSHDITWSGEGFLGDVKIEYSIDNGSNWKVIAENTGNNGVYSWVVPNEPSPTCRIRVSESVNANPVDESDAVFKIEDGTAIQDQDKNPGKFHGSFDIVPNPANCGFDQKVSFILKPTESIQDATIKVFDALGNIIYESEKLLICNANQQYAFHPWYLKNFSGRPVGCGTYLAVLMARGKDGKAVVVKKMVGVKNN